MTCREFEHRTTALTLWELSQAQDQQILDHAGECQKCAAWLQRQRTLAATMQTLQARTAACAAGPDVERALLRVFRQGASQPVQPEMAHRFTPIAMRLSRFFEVGAYVAVGAAIVVALFLGVRLGLRVVGNDACYTDAWLCHLALHRHVYGALIQKPHPQEKCHHDGRPDGHIRPDFEEPAEPHGDWSETVRHLRLHRLGGALPEYPEQRPFHIGASGAGGRSRLQRLHRSREGSLPLQPGCAFLALARMVQDLLVLRLRQLPQSQSGSTMFEFTACHDKHLAVTLDIPGAAAAECCSLRLSMSCARCSRERMVPSAHPRASAASA